jgi:hypothetical protein
LDITTLGTSQASKAVTVDADGDLIIPDSDKFEFGSGSDMTLYHDGTNSYITNKTGALKVATETSGIAITLGHGTSEVTVADNLTVAGNLTVSGTQTVVDTVTMQAQNAILFEGATADSYETILTMVDPTADRTVTLPNATDTLVGKATTDTLTNKTLTSAVLNTGVSGSAVLDEDDFTSDSATKLATQQSIKAYVDTAILTEDTIAELNDTTITGTPADNEVLAYDTTASKWINQTPAEASLVSLTGSETLTNKTLASPTFTTNFTIGSATITETELEILDGATVTTAELNIMDGDTSASSVTLADADRMVVNDNGTMKQVAVTDMTTYIGDPIAMAIALG